MVVLHNSVHLDDTMLIPLNLLKDVIGLNLSQNLDNSLFKACTSHQRSVVWCGESFFSDFDLLDRLHSVTDLVVHLIHEITNTVASSSSSFVW